MQLTPSRLAALAGPHRVVKAAALDGPPAQRDPAVVATVSQMLLRIEAGGMDAVLAYARDLDGWSGGDVELSAAEFARIGDGLPAQVRAGLELGHERTTAFAREQRAHLVDFEVEIAPGLVTGQRYVPVPSVGAYLPAGRFPLTTSAHMTVGVAKVAGVPNVIACTPPRPDGSPDPAVTYTALLAGTDRVSCSAASRRSPRWPSGCSARDPSTCSSAPATPSSPRRSASCSGGWASTCSPDRRRSR